MFTRHDNLAGRSATRSFAITAADADLAEPTRWLYVGTAGTLVVRLQDDTTERTIANAAVGYHPLCCARVAAATTAANLVGLI